jgi:hypothetical protein
MTELSALCCFLRDLRDLSFAADSRTNILKR